MGSAVATAVSAAVFNGLKSDTAEMCDLCQGVGAAHVIEVLLYAQGIFTARIDCGALSHADAPVWTSASVPHHPILHGLSAGTQATMMPYGVANAQNLGNEAVLRLI